MAPGLILEDGCINKRKVMQDEGACREALRRCKAADKQLFDRTLNGYPPRQKLLLEKFVTGETKESLTDRFDVVAKQADQEKVSIGDLIPIDLDIYNDKEKKDPIESYKYATFYNWGQNILNGPLYTCIPKTVFGVQSIVTLAKSIRCGVRVAGYRHSWSSIFGRDKSEDRPFILISLLALERAILGAQANEEALGKWSNIKIELNKIEALDQRPSSISSDQTLVRIGCSATNEDLRRWCLDKKLLTLPLNVIMVAITLGGSNAPICHGAGIKQKTLSDLVYAVEYVDVNGKLQKITQDQKEFLSVASGCFGLLGVVTHLTLVLDKMSYAAMKPLKVPVLEAIPPPEDMVKDLPKELKDKYDKYKPDQIKKFVQDFEKRAMNEYYAEWFWFPLHDQVWINTWSLTQDSASVKDYPDTDEILKQVNETFALEFLQESYRKDRFMSPESATKFISQLAMDALPADCTIETWLPNALHFRRGIHNVRVRDVELEIPLPSSKTNSNTPDLGIVRKAWWQAILLTYENIATCPMRMPLEVRIMGGSDVLMAPQYGNKLGTCAMEILTPRFMEAEWHDFAQAMIDKWMTLRQWNGQDLNIRPHFAKEWDAFRVDGQPWPEYLKKKSCSKEIAKFTSIIKKIGNEQGWTVEELRKMFSNRLLDTLFFE
ncbi:hypothetical protein D8B26_007284 [Coccidioides posadasii str. Silveira]|uniref:Uncharacterized protein n=3 Tax=Coccidioides posadasii TaxID=199306 RepID=E9D3B6_COCPS|nr:hypothetical protein CPC735_013260 [Coccidioides posadasii C735 delta SOWgp]EER30008.1 hypothetical protein CPC735_013260 [Coccidioides posadasii C735 delta SOWgp]EFW19111.1 conserved hypothetical protein [Coccidioides posadasii str. Silveira]KMM71457.1 hypothetical protein CPAG_07764 [Coccidioides posadasii RMSCC 3488]QVM12665.1 hypothetical protein D8B26_007284 [Coccidioides posadasii str. Silveira]|eukprot:XP_003072153.1 hypothetical protein CPC735_013260 [Coccidioides posadasii C735 delta SOWgp]